MEAVWYLTLLFLGVQAHDLHLSSSNATKKISLLDNGDGSSLILDVPTNKLAVINPKLDAAVLVDLNENKGFYMTHHQLVGFGQRQRAGKPAKTADDIVDVIDRLYADYEEVTTTPLRPTKSKIPPPTPNAGHDSPESSVESLGPGPEHDDPPIDFQFPSSFTVPEHEPESEESVKPHEPHEPHVQDEKSEGLIELLFNFLKIAAPKVGEVFDFDRGVSKGKELLMKTLEKMSPKVSTLIRDNPVGLRPVLHHVASVLRGLYDARLDQPTIKNFDIEGLYRANLTRHMIRQAISPNQTVVPPVLPMGHLDVPAIQLLNDMLKNATEGRERLPTLTSVLQLLGNISEKTNGLHVVDVVTAQLIAIKNPSDANIKTFTRILLEYTLSPRQPRVLSKGIHDTLHDLAKDIDGLPGGYSNVLKPIGDYMKQSDYLDTIVEEVAGLQRQGTLDDLMNILISHHPTIPLQRSIPDLILAAISKLNSDQTPRLPKLFPQLPDIFKIKPFVKNLFGIGKGVVDPIAILKKNRITAAILSEIGRALVRVSRNRIKITAIFNLALDLNIVRELPNVLKSLFMITPKDEADLEEATSHELVVTN